MPLTGQAKTNYQREYMRKRRSNAGSNEPAVCVRPVTSKTVRPKTKLARPAGISDNQWAYIQMKAESGDT